MPQGHFKSSTPDSKAAAILILATNSRNICVSSVVARPGFMLAVVARGPQKRKAEPRSGPALRFNLELQLRPRAAGGACPVAEQPR